MRVIIKRLLIGSLGFLMISCLSESGKDPGKPSTFVRYYSGGTSDQAVDMRETADKGLAIIGNTLDGIKFFKTDEEGFVQSGPVIFNEDNSQLKDSVITYSASGFEIIPSGGYVITGSRNTIRTSDQQALFTKPLVITLDANGSLVKKVIGANGLSGKAVTVNSGGNFLILSTDNDSQMVLTELKASDLTSSWFNAYGAGDGLTLARRLFLDENSKVYWGGFVQKTLSGIRFIRTAQKSQNTDFDLLYKSSPISTASDFCRFGFDFAFIGNSTADSLFVKRITRDGIVAFSKSYTFPVGSVAPVTVTPNSVNSTQDGGLVVLATVNKAGTQISDNDYALLKINAFGEPSWTQIFGSPRFQDNGVSVLQASNGGLWVLGTTTQGGIAIITLTKTDKNGKIE